MQDIHGKIAEITALTDRIREIVIVGADGGPLPHYAPGSHIKISLPTGDTRSYSLISFGQVEAAPKRYRIAVQREPEGKGGSAYMHQLAEGDGVRFGPPANDFPLDPSAPAVLLAGGIGITPLISMAGLLQASGQAFVLHFAGRSAGVMPYRDALAKHFGADLHLHFDDDAATALHLDAVIGGIGAQTHLYICGPRGMIDAAKAKAESMGFDAARIHIELFDTEAVRAGDSAFEIELASTGQVFTVAPGQSIIDALEEGGVDVIYDCQRGDCGICQCDVISGTPDHRDVVLSETERASGKVMQICVSRAKSPRLVLDI